MSNLDSYNYPARNSPGKLVTMILLLVAILQILTGEFSGATVKGKKTKNSFKRQFRCVFLSTLRSVSRTYIKTHFLERHLGLAH